VNGGAVAPEATAKAASAALDAEAPGWAQRRIGGKVSLHRVSKSFGTLKVLDNISLTVPSGSVPF